MFKKLLLFLIIGIFSFSNNSLAYDDKTTHPALTDEIVDFYNLSFPDKQLTPQQKEWIIEGSILEDIAPRWINHFYDPIYKVGWSGEKTGEISQEFVQNFSSIFIAFLADPLSVVEWINNRSIQEEYRLYGGDRTWKKALKYYADGNLEQAYKTLGYVLHLLQDQSVPEHTRNDTHAHEVEKLTGDYGSPYEEYLKKYDRQEIKKLNITQNLKKENLQLIIKLSIEDYLISLATYSNNYFFSKDTINDPKYQNPKIIRDDGNFGYGKDENGKEFLLTKIKRITTDDGIIIKDYTIDIGSESILSAYFSRLSRQAVLHGAGAIDLFYKQAQEEIVRKEYPVHLVEYDTSKLAFPLISVVGAWYRVSSFFASIGDFFSGIFTSDNGFQPAGEVALDQFSEVQSPQINNQYSEIELPKVKQCSFNTSQSPSRSKLIINEVAWMGTTNSADDEWVELKNISGAEINLIGYQLIDQAEQIKIVFGSSDKISSNGFYLLERTDDDSAPNVKADKIYTGALSNLNEGLRLFDGNCSLVDEVLANPNWPAGDNPSKKTMERTNNFSWYTSSIVGGTPRRTNSNQQLTTDSQPQIIQEEADDEAAQQQVLYGTSTLQQATSSPQQTATIKQCSFQTNQSPSRQKILINEVAWMGGSDSFGLTANDEWIELKNISNSEIDLNGWQILDKSEKIKIVFSASNKILAGGFYLLERTNDNSVPNVTADLIYSNTLNNSDEGLRLFDNQCSLIDEVLANSGSDGKQWPAGDNIQKRTMERSPDFSWHTYNGTAQNSIFGTPKKENSAPNVAIQSSSGGGSGGGTSTNNQQPTTDNQQQTTTNSTSSPAKILINEVQMASTASVNDEFVELYNPNDTDINLTDWYLQKETKSGTSSISTFASKDLFSGKTIGPRQYLLIANASSTFSSSADILTKSIYSLADNNTLILKNPNGDIVDKVGWGEAGDCEGSCAPQPLDDQSLQRKFQDNTFIDTDNNAEDFEIQTCPSPKAQFCSQTAAPNPYNFSAQYSSSTMELIFSWQPIEISSALAYKIFDISSSTSVVGSSTIPIIETASTTAKIVIDEAGRDYQFLLEAFNESDMSFGTSTVAVNIPSFLPGLYFYADPRASSTNYSVELFYDQYPFIPDVYQNGNNSAWKVLIFYLNSEPEKEIYLDPSFSHWYPWPQETIDKILKIKYGACAGGVGGPYVLILPDIAENCSVWGGLRNISANYRFEDKNFAIAAVSSTAETAFSSNDYLTVAYYSFYSSGWWKGLPEVFQLAAVDKTKYYFQENPPEHFPPDIIGDLQFTFDDESLSLATSWSVADSDTLDNLLRHEISYDEGQFWQAISKPSHQITVEWDTVYNIQIRAIDDFGLESAIVKGSFTTPIEIPSFEQNLIQQPKKTTPMVPQPGYTSGIIRQNLGSSLDGTFSEVVLHLQAGDANTDGYYYYLAILDVSDNWSKLCEVNKVVDGTFSTKQDVIFQCGEPKTFISGHSYQIFFSYLYDRQKAYGGQGNFGGFNIWGSTIPESYPDGQAIFDNSSVSIADIYFKIR